MTKISGKRILIILLAVFALFELVSAGLSTWERWITPGERKELRAALDRIDEVRDFRGSDASGYQQKVDAARQAIAACKKHEITGRDRNIVLSLGLQLQSYELEQRFRSKQNVDPRFSAVLHQLEDGDKETNAMLRNSIQ